MMIDFSDSVKIQFSDDDSFRPFQIMKTKTKHNAESLLF